ncbi:MAG: NUDIX hydrolase [Kocuria sp.]|nr:NUDIX hydrolase [Kocuria sp.]
MKMIVHENPWFSVVRYVGPRGTWFRLKAPDSAIVISEHEGEVIFIRGTRPFSSSRPSMELPGGVVEPDETPAQAIERECREETGYKLAELKPLGSFKQSAAVSDSFCHVFHGQIVGEGEANLDLGEDWSVVKVRKFDIQAVVNKGEIEDAATLAALTLWGCV